MMIEADQRAWRPRGRRRPHPTRGRVPNRVPEHARSTHTRTLERTKTSEQLSARSARQIDERVGEGDRAQCERERANASEKPPGRWVLCRTRDVRGAPARENLLARGSREGW